MTLFVPGRVNLIGEHTDYNGGLVLPTALNIGVTVSMSPRRDDNIHIVSDAFDTVAQRTIQTEKSGHWSDYVTGAIKLANEKQWLVGGANVALTSTLPFGAGLSSSAAVTVGILKLARDMSGAKVSDTACAIFARRVENEFIGVPCGIMDQMAVALAHPGQALALNTNDLSYQLIDLPKGTRVAVIHSGHQRLLEEGRYAERKAECDAVKHELGHDNICHATPEEMQQILHLPDHIYARASHCVSEEARTTLAIEALRANDMKHLGELLIEGHASIRDDFEITVDATDKLVEDAVGFGAFGARQTGGGFGGCIVALVAEGTYPKWVSDLLAAHPNAYDVLKVPT